MHGVECADVTSLQTVKIGALCWIINLPPITSPPENTDKVDVILDSEDKMTDSGEEEAKCEVSLPQKTQEKSERSSKSL